MNQEDVKEFGLNENTGSSEEGVNPAEVINDSAQGGNSQEIDNLPI